MPKLPTVESFGRRPSSRSPRRVVLGQFDIAQTAEVRGLRQVGAAQQAAANDVSNALNSISEVATLYAAAGVTGPDDDESWGAWLFKEWIFQMAGGLPVIRDFISSAVGDFPFEVSPPVSTVKKGFGVIEQIKQGEVDRGAVSAALAAAGLLAPVPIPTGQIMIMGDYFVDQMAGEKDGFNPVEAFVKRDYRN